MEAKGVDVDPARRQVLRHGPEGVGERWGLRVGVDEDERAPRLDTQLEEADAFELEAGLALGAGASSQAAFEVVSPRVVVALQGLASAAALNEHGAAMTADVEEGAQALVAAADDDDRESPTRVLKYSPGLAACSAGPAYCHARRKMRSCSRGSVCGSEYQLHGKVA